MDVSKFKKLLSLLPFSGFCLSPEEALLTENSLIILQNDQKFAKIFFWGNILTTGLQDYYIAFGFRQDSLRRKFLYSQNLLNWSFLPNVSQNTYETALMCNKMFQGDPGLVLEVAMPPKFELENDRIEQKPGETRQLKEEQRLACVVQMISDATMIIPRGALFNQVEELLTFNPNFEGLGRNDARDLRSYQFYREPVNEYNYNLLKREKYNYSTDFLDTLDDLVPVNKSFGLTWERDEEIVVLRSLHWMGASFLHEIGSPLFLFNYSGDGKINHDLLFMV